MARGFTRCEYVDDDGTIWSLMVDADHAEDPIRGWNVADSDDLPPVPRGWLPRLVVGIDDSGRQQTARVGRVDAALWAGTVLSFTAEANDGTTVTAEVTAYLSEKRGHFR